MLNQNEIKIKLSIDGKESIATLNMADSEVKKLLQSTAKFNSSSKGFGGSITGGSYGAKMAISQLGFAMGDVSMITTNTRMAIMGFSNNFPFIIQGFQQMSQTAKEAGHSIKQELAASLTGGGGLILGANAAMFIFQTLPVLIESLNKNAKEAAEEGLKSFERELKNINSYNIEQKISDVNAELKALNITTEQQKEIMGPYFALWVEMFGSNTKYAIDAASKKMDKLKDKQKEISEQDKTRIGHMKNIIANLDAQINAVENEVGSEKKIWDLLDKKANAQKELNLLLETSEERNKRINDLLQKQRENWEKIEKAGKEITDNILAKQLNQMKFAFDNFDLPMLEDMQMTAEGAMLEQMNKFLKQPETYDQMIERYINSSQRLIDESQGKSAKRLNKDLMNAAVNFTNQLATGMAKAGKSFLNYMAIALQAAIKIIDIVGSINKGEKSTASGVLDVISSVLPFLFMAQGGIINEPVMGIGKSGRGYLLGERGSEAVIPLNQLSEMKLGANINVNVKVDSRTRGTDIEYVARKVTQKRLKYG